MSAQYLNLLTSYLNLTGEELLRSKVFCQKKKRKLNNIEVIAAYQTWKKILMGVIDVATAFHLHLRE